MPQAALDILLTLAGLIVVFALAPLMGWALQGVRSKRGGIVSSVMDGFASVFQTEQVRLQDAKREKNKGGRENGDPPDLVG